MLLYCFYAEIQTNLEIDGIDTQLQHGHIAIWLLQSTRTDHFH